MVCVSADLTKRPWTAAWTYSARYLDFRRNFQTISANRSIIPRYGFHSLSLLPGKTIEFVGPAHKSSLATPGVLTISTACDLTPRTFHNILLHLD